MNRRIIALLLAAAMALTLGGVSVFAADPPEAEQAAAAGQEEPAGENENAGPQETDADQADAGRTEGGEPPEEASAAEEAEIVPDPLGSVSFANLDSRLRENNFNMLALEENIAAIEATDYDKLTDDLRDSLNKIADAQGLLLSMGGMPGLSAGEQIALSVSGSVASQTYGQTYDALRETFDDLKEGKLQADNADVVRQLRNAQDQIVMAAESLYVALVEMEQSDKTLDRSLTALDRTIQELELRYELGQFSALTLQTGKAGRTSLVSGRQTLEMNISTYKTQLEMLLGAELTGNIRLQALPQVTDKQLAAMDLEADLAAAKEASYELYAAAQTLEDAEEDYKDTAKDYNYNENKYQYVQAKHVWQAAQYTYNATIQSFELKFRTLYAQVEDYKQILDAARTALACEQAEYASMQLKYEQGSISQNKLLDAGDEVSAAQDKVDSAAIDLFSAYNSYRWAVDYGILN